MRMRPLFAFAVGCLAISAATEREARATGFDIPELGTEAMGRGGAWTARADTPLAAVLNPAGLAGQKSGATVDLNLVWQKYCFQRFGNYDVNADTGNTAFAGSSYGGQPYPEVCKNNGFGDVNPNPAVIGNWAISDKLGVAFGVVSPSAAGKSDWPDRVTLADGSLAPAPQRYMLLKADGVVLMPTLAAGYEVIPGVRFGAAFQMVIASLKFSNMSIPSYGTATAVAESPSGDLRADLAVKKLFTPAIILGALVSPHDDVDIGATFRWSADIVAKNGTVDVVGPYYGNGKGGAVPASSHATVDELRVPQPWEVRLGVRYHPKRKDAAVTRRGERRDFLANDVFDIELDGTYSHNSSFDTLGVTFGPNQCIDFGNAKCPNTIPTDTSIPHNWRDTVGVRLGGEYVVLPNQLGVRIGGFFQGNGQNPDFAALDFLPSSMFGVMAGATYRVSKLVDVHLGIGKIFLHGLDNGPNGEVRGLTAVTGSGSITCPNGSKPPDFHTCFPVNSGKYSGGYTLASLGATFHL